MSTSDGFNYGALRSAVLQTAQAVGRFIVDTDLGQLHLHRDTEISAKATDDQTREVDVRSLEVIKSSLRSELPSSKMFLVSEENPMGEPLNDTPDFPDIVLVVDPIDNSDGAVHGDACFSAITVYSRGLNKILAAVVCDPSLNLLC
jgi:fructose-1,6-bisphosphatase/inositol monophosphatase family enzyme